MHGGEGISVGLLTCIGVCDILIKSLKQMLIMESGMCDNTDLLKKKLTEMLGWFHEFCVTHGLRYYALSGTMLGAVRHGGFIPWDDDIDVGMPRRDFERLSELLSKENNGRYVLETPESDDPAYFYPFSKLYDTATTLIEHKRYTLKRGIYLDIFPLDGTGNTEEESVTHYRKVEKKYNLLLARTGATRQGRAWYKNAALRLLQMIPSCFVSDKRILRNLVELFRRYDYDECAWFGNLASSWRLREVMPRKIMGEPRLYPFEGLFIYGVADADAYLTHVYGDWRTPPPPEKRVTHHDYVFCDLERSYLDAEE